MVSATPIRKFQTFTPEVASALGRAFDEACRCLQETGVDLAPSMTMDKVRETLAGRIIYLAQHGEHDVVQLRDGALSYLAGLGVRKQA